MVDGRDVAALLRDPAPDDIRRFLVLQFLENRRRRNRNAIEELRKGALPDR